jgi:CMP-N,N'-diacetyllegionaminic acid synthase
MTVLALIPARGGSKGIPDKNIVELAGQPLIGWTIDAARGANCLDRIVVSTDSDVIISVARGLGAEAPFLRPAALATDHSPSIDVVIHALKWLNNEQEYAPDAIMLLQPTSPLRTSEDILAAVSLFEKNAREGDTVMAVARAGMHPDLTMKMDASGCLVDYTKGKKCTRRQDQTPAYGPNGSIYIAWAEDILNGGTFKGSRVLPYLMPEDRSLDIDSEWDLDFCRWWIHRRSQRAGGQR